MTKRFFTLLISLVAMIITANAQVIVNETTFPDDKFRELVMRQYSYYIEIDAINYYYELQEGITELYIYNDFDLYGIKSLKGIEYFTELELLSCNYNQLTSLDVSKNTALKQLECSGNQLTSLDVSGCAELEILRCYDNKLTSLDVSNNTALTELWCSGNQLTSLDVSKNTALTRLDCCYNQLTELDVSGCTALTDLECDNNQLFSLNVSGCTGLTRLECCFNRLFSLDVSEKTALTYLDCSDNRLVSLDFSGCIALTELNCGYNLLTSINASGCAALESLICYRNELISLNVSGCAALTSLPCSRNRLTSLDVSKNTALEGLNCSSNELTSLDVSKNTALTYLSCDNNQLSELDISKNTALKYLYCYSNQIKGEAMDALVASLPTAESGEFYVIDTKNEHEGNVCTKTQVAVAKGKGWTVYDYYGGGIYYQYRYVYPEYEGSEDELLLDEENFSDNNFREALAEILNIAEGDEISEEFIKNLTTLDVSEKTIADLSGIEYFTALTTLYCHINQIKNEKMTALITALPDLSDNEAKGVMRTEETNPRKGALYALDFTADDEQNVCTAEHVAAANAKGWTVYCKTTNGWQEYTGEVPTGIGASLNDNGKMINDNYYSIDGVKLSGEPTKKGLYIHKGKKVVK